MKYWSLSLSKSAVLNHIDNHGKIQKKSKIIIRETVNFEMRL